MSTHDQRALPENYRTVLAVVEAAGPGTHLSAQDVFQRARQQRPGLGFATVHRALTRLHEEGRLFKIDVPGAAMAYYEPLASPHAHFRCSGCGALEDVDYALPRGTVEDLARRQGVAIEHVALTFSGRCRECA